jgi:hypothetical protein
MIALSDERWITMVSYFIINHTRLSLQNSSHAISHHNSLRFSCLSLGISWPKITFSTADNIGLADDAAAIAFIDREMVFSGSKMMNISAALLFIYAAYIAVDVPHWFKAHLIDATIK